MPPARRRAPGHASACEADAPARTLLRALGHDPADVDTLAARTRLPVPDIMATLTALELDRRVAALPGGIWQRID